MSKFTANRVVLILHGAFVVLTAAGVFIATVSHSLPVKWQATLAAAVVILGALAAGTVAVTKFLDGSQKFDALQTRAAAPPLYGAQISPASSSGSNTVVTSSFTPAPQPPADNLEQGPDQNDAPARTRQPVTAVTA